MAYIRIGIQNGMNNVSCQVGDVVYKSTLTQSQATTGFTTGDTPVKVGTVYSLLPTLGSPKTGIMMQTDLTVAQYNLSSTKINTGDFVMFSKDNRANLSSMLGYYMQADFKNNSTHEATLFSVGSEVSISSK